MTTVFVIAVSVMAVALVLWNAGIVRRFQNDYRYDGEFLGQRYECILTFANSEYGTRCSLGADESALYLLAALRERYRGGKTVPLILFSARIFRFHGAILTGGKSELCLKIAFGLKFRRNEFIFMWRGMWATSC